MANLHAGHHLAQVSQLMTELGLVAGGRGEPRDLHRNLHLSAALHLAAEVTGGWAL